MLVITVDDQQTRGIVNRVASVRNPNDSLNRDVLVPNSDITILGIHRTEETELEASFFRNQGCFIIDGLEWANVFNCRKN
ncbi:hypothetical protein TIFTF001_035197 [Ficus carica]|uniref:Uncharacterized protein n=1 Tax=Ficus carica TaxID=3494 RepID=A0AA88E4C6_FICCA|nr:hypothetical protein TIFTF001_035197 [Ficus carica]